MMDQDFIILDVGCGSKPQGSINLDRFFKRNPHHRFNYDLKKFNNPVLADGYILPFKTNSVDLIWVSHVLEHLKNPLEAINEFRRVSRKYVIIKVPNNPTLEEFSEHLYSWSLISFKNFLSLEFPRVKIYVNSPISDMMKNRVFKKLLRIRLIKKPMQRIISRYLGLELIAICRVY